MSFQIRTARKEDVFQILSMLANDKLGKLREELNDPVPESYIEAFKEISESPVHELLVVEDEKGAVVGTLQVSYLRYLTYCGGLRAQIEAVRIREDQRGHGLGQLLINTAIEMAKEQGAHLVQLTTDTKRPEALEFYEKLGFVSSHHGLKLHL